MEEKNHPVLDVGIAVLTQPGEKESGDLHVVAPFAAGVLVAVVDGIGHGPEAAKVAKVAEGIMKHYPHENLQPLIQRCHDALHGTRGVVMSLASFNHQTKVMTWVGVGNVQGNLLPMDKLSRPQTLLLSMGTLGQKIGSVHPTELAVKPGDTLIFTTDGIREDFHQGLNLKQSPQQLAHDILARSARYTDDALVLVGRYVI